MRFKTVLPMFVVLMMLSVPFVSLYDSNVSDAAESEDTDNGMIVIKGLAIYNGEPLNDDSVTAYLIAGYVTGGKGYYRTDPTQYESSMGLKTDVSGKQYNFSFEVPRTVPGNGDYYLCIMNTYKIQSVSTYLSYTPTVLTRDMSVQWETNPGDYTAYEVKNTSYGAAGQNEFFITSTDEGSTNKITLSPARVPITGSVGFTDSYGVYKSLYNADVRLVSTAYEHLTFTDTTDREGKFTIRDVPTGEYRMSVILGGYQEFETVVNIQENTVNEFQINIIPNNESTLFGMDFAHVLMSVAGILGVVVLLTSLVLQYRVRKESKDLVLNDMQEQDEFEEK